MSPGSGWGYRAGVPRGVRRQKAEELRSHLLESVDDDRTIRDVVGDDVAAFASEWAAAERSRPLLDLALQLVAAATLVPGAYALLHPALASLVGEQETRVGLPGSMLASLVAVVVFFGGWHLLRVKRHRFTTQHAALLGVVLFAGYLVLFVVSTRWRESDAFLAMAPSTAWTLVLLGAGVQGVASWIKRTGGDERTASSGRARAAYLLQDGGRRLGAVKSAQDICRREPGVRACGGVVPTTVGSGTTNRDV